MTHNLPRVLATIEDPDKVELITKMLKGEPQEKQRYLFVIEYSRVSKSLGFVKFEVFGSEKTIFRFKIQQDVSPRTGARSPFSNLSAQQNQQFSWNSLGVGKKHYTVGLVDVEEEGIWKKIQKGVNTCLEEGEVPFLSSLIPMK
jgi:hypothetical protein